MDPKDQVKQQLDIVEFIGQYVTLKPAGKNFRGLCPFHNEKSPSFNVSADMQIYKCFGCGEAGDIFSFYMKQEGVGFVEALHDLARLAGVELTEYQPSGEFEQKQRLLEIHHLTVPFYHYLLTEHKIGKAAKDYLQERGVTSSQMKEFQLGYAPDTWSSLGDYLIKKKKVKPVDLEQSGLAIRGQQGNLYDRFRGRVMFPLTDVRGNVVAFSGRVLPWTDDGKSGKYINSPETLLYHKRAMLFGLDKAKEAAKKQEQLVMVEGELDVLASRRAGVLETVAVKGTALTPEQLKLIKRYCQTVVLSLDSDSAGIEAAKRAIKLAQEVDINVRVVELTQGKDPDELVRQDPKQWRHLVKQAVHIYDFFIHISLQDNDPKTLEGKQRINEALTQLLAQEKNHVIVDHFAKKIAELVNVDTKVIYQEIERSQKKSQLPVIKTVYTESKAETPSSRLDLLLKEWLAYLLAYPHTEIVKAIRLKDMPVHAISKVVEVMQQNLELKPAELVKKLPEELRLVFQEAFLLEVEPLNDLEVKAHLEKLQTEVADLFLRDKLGQLRKELQQVESPDRHRQLLKEIDRLSKRRHRYGRG